MVEARWRGIEAQAGFLASIISVLVKNIYECWSGSVFLLKMDRILLSLLRKIKKDRYLNKMQWLQ